MPDEGCMGIVWCAISEDIRIEDYFFLLLWKETKARKLDEDPELAEDLWNQSYARWRELEH